MAAILLFAFVCLFRAVNNELLCESGFCRTYGFDVGCSAPMQHCRINNETHAGIWMSSPTVCNCCEYCLPVLGEGHHCSLGGPGDGTGIGRCGDGLTCVQEDDGNHCRRMETECHEAQDEFDLRYENGEVGALEERPVCDAKGNFGILNCVPTQTCYCQSEEGQRIFGEVLYLGASTLQNTPCGCSRMNEKIKKMITPGVPHPVIGPRCTSDGNFNPVQCYNRTCFCVNVLTGQMRPDEKVDLDEEPITELACYDPDLDLFPELSQGDAPYNYLTPCYEDMIYKINLIQDSVDAGYIMDFYNSVPECLEDGTYGRILETTNGSKICVDPRGDQIGDYEALPNTSEYEDMNCNCALTTIVMESVYEKPICCKNGNFRKIQCRRGKCHCVDENGRQITQETSSVTSLSCYTENWRSC